MPKKKKALFFPFFIRFILPFLLLVLGLAIFLYFKASTPHVKRGRPTKKASTLVKVITAEQVNATPTIKAMGTVVPSRKIKLSPRVSGQIVEVSDDFVPGGVVRKGQKIIHLDPSDYEIALKEKKSAVDKAEADLNLEKGNQQAAKEELSMFQKSTSIKGKDWTLALRKPQLNKAKAELDRARADLEQARLDLSRTIIKAPFNALILDRQVNLGSEVSRGQELATLVGTDTYWVEARLPIDRLSLLRFGPQIGAPVDIISQTGKGQWSGQAIRITGRVDETALMAVIIIAVEDPLGLEGEKTPRSNLLINDYVQANFQGRLLKEVVQVPRKALRNPGTIWLVKDGKLDMRQVSLVWKNSQSAFISSGLKEGEEVIVSDISTPVQGMVLKKESSSPSDNSRSNARQGQSRQDR